MKLNTDGMAQGASGRAAAGSVFRDHRGVVIVAYCFNVGIGSLSWEYFSSYSGY